MDFIQKCMHTGRLPLGTPSEEWECLRPATGPSGPSGMGLCKRDKLGSAQYQPPLNKRAWAVGIDGHNSHGHAPPPALNGPVPALTREVLTLIGPDGARF